MSKIISIVSLIVITLLPIIAFSGGTFSTPRGEYEVHITKVRDALIRGTKRDIFVGQPEVLAHFKKTENAITYLRMNAPQIAYRKFNEPDGLSFEISDGCTISGSHYQTYYNTHEAINGYAFSVVWRGVTLPIKEPEISSESNGSNGSSESNEISEHQVVPVSLPPAPGGPR